MTGRDLPPRFKRAHARHIHHPVLRLWQRMIAGSIFGRNEHGCVMKGEIEIIGSFLNVECQEGFGLCIATMIAKHWATITSKKDTAKRRINKICGGGIITVLAKGLAGFTEGGRVYVGSDTDCLLDYTYLSQTLHWLQKRDSKYYWSYEGEGRYSYPLPSRLLPELIPEPDELPSYLLGPVTSQYETGQGSGVQHSPPDSPPAYEEPPHHSPPHIPGAAAYAPPPPPPTNYDRMLQMMNQMYIDQQRALYPTLRTLHQQGQLTDADPLPSWFQWPSGAYQGGQYPPPV
ncbi:hypothetical protein RND81_02G176600 [Saponaria officinalis]|uniref:Uncharacterized protein n=1 Tax=Saponaria officinalis TaxID=3572 RepID=A0AAW1MVI4_SAPOF